MTRSCCPRRGARSTPPLADKDHKLAAYNNDLVVAITEVIVGPTIPIENHLISSEVLFGLNPKTLPKTAGKRMGRLPFLSPADVPERKKERGP